mmetsp:Transcript_75876/g.180293  ORF Transcript_75876/g.180293 Transcript_75876/m.180293 type:complete len:192 (+) Transcript_75876:95-670(+)|eukprot:CAMPEP_0178420010 /NCGR_PEP_ID=MMETSP0689_2-20121128/25909_1 /TAXON_ID=160604 /ORGANISM="Amphidinium massartii, Strain CS-259" /LENGTH=191 /DNA_ID=CAMNT_0020041473 /DNA_START=87 /DNA_END=662 /DNA_ORIENTATION=+
MAPRCSGKQRCLAVLAVVGAMVALNNLTSIADLTFLSPAPRSTDATQLLKQQLASERGHASGASAEGMSPDASGEASRFLRGVFAVAAAVLVGLSSVSPAEAARSGKNWLNPENDAGDYGFSSSTLGSKLDETYNRVKPICKDVEMMVQGGSRLGSEQGMIRVQCELPEGVEVSKREEDPFAQYSGYSSFP